MARLPISLLALLLVASYASATTIQELCKGTYDADYCVAMLKSTVYRSTDFNSEGWRKKVLNRVLVKAIVAKNFVVDKSRKLIDSEVLKTCVQTLSVSVNLIKQGSLDEAATNQDNCSDSLEDGGEVVQDVKTLANEAAMATKVANDIIASV